MLLLLCVSDQSKQEFSHQSVDNDSRKGLSFSAVVRRAASVASEAAKHAYAAASATRDEGMIPLKCCLMSISLPWEHIAHDLLFKVRAISISTLFFLQINVFGYFFHWSSFHE